MRHTWTIVALLCATSCVSSEAHRQALNANANLQAQNADLSDAQRKLALENERLRKNNEDLSKRAADATWIEDQKKQLARLMERFQSGAVGGGEGIELVETPEGLAIRVAGEVLFSPGQNTLSDNGKKTLNELAKQIGDRPIRIEGHTDDQPIVRSQWGTNLRLSVERSMVVADYLTKSSGLKEGNVSVAGYGEFRPARPGSDDAARQKNRRVEILMLK